jgi:hypothetical protein
MRRFNTMDLLPGGKKEFRETIRKLTYKSPEEIQKDKQDLELYLKEIQNTEISFDKRLDSILKVNSLIIPLLFSEMLSDSPDIYRSMVASKVITAIKETGKLLIKKREIELVDEINLNSPKFQLVFGWFLEVINGVLKKQGMNELQLNSIFQELSLELSDWEDRVMKKLKGLSSKALDEIENPFLKTLKEKKL